MPYQIIEGTYHSLSLNWKRKYYVYLPSNYDGKKVFPVLYFFDGDNFYNKEKTLSKESWEVPDTLEKMIKKHQTHGYICVGISTSSNRLLEYAPVHLSQKFLPNSFDGNHEPKGDLTFTFFDEIKNMIEKTYLINGKNYIVGSSCGGIMALYFIMRASNEYAGAGIFSPATILLVDRFHEMLREAQISSLTKAYIYMGGKEDDGSSQDMKDANVNEAKLIFSSLQEKKIHTKLSIDPEGVHNELAWAKAFPSFIEYLEKGE